MTKINLGIGYKVDGFAAENVKEGEKLKVITKRSIISDEPEFYKYIEQISNMFINKIGNTAYISSFVILVHQDTSADLYVGDLGIILNINPKRDFKKGEPVYKKDIADIREMKFNNINIETTDKFICCLKVGWKFGLFFDFNYEKNLDLENIFKELGSIYRYLEFQYIYNILESKNKFDEILQDGWFPFIEIIGSDDKILIDLYENKKFDYENKINNLVNTFDQKRIEQISNKWWKKDVLNNKKQIIQAGLNSFLLNNKDGYINCIKNLLSELEGVIRIKYFNDTNFKKPKFSDLIKFIIDKGREKSGSDDSLYLPVPFFNYLSEVIFKDFDLSAESIDLSRHSSGHGVATEGVYTKERALQIILCLDQIYYYLE